jgi:hypothetical protein
MKDRENMLRVNDDPSAQHDYDPARWNHWERQLEKARREGMIAGLERVLAVGYPDWVCERRIRAEIERLKREQD